MALLPASLHGLEAYQSWFIALGIGSALLFVLSLVLLPWLLSRIPADYFKRQAQNEGWAFLLSPRVLVRNSVGLMIVSAGVIMLFLPGQGLLTILVGVALMQFPKKLALERWIMGRKGVLTAVNWLRLRTHTPPLEL